MLLKIMSYLSVIAAAEPPIYNHGNLPSVKVVINSLKINWITEDNQPEPRRLTQKEQLAVDGLIELKTPRVSPPKRQLPVRSTRKK